MHFELEIAFDAAFEKPMRRVDVEGTELRLTPGLAEAFYYWRVRAKEKSRPRAPYSEGRQFRYLHKPLPSTPKLLTPEFEVPDAPKPSKGEKSGWLWLLVGGVAYLAGGLWLMVELLGRRARASEAAA